MEAKIKQTRILIRESGYTVEVARVVEVAAIDSGVELASYSAEVFSGDWVRDGERVGM